MRLIDADALLDNLEAAGGTGAAPNSWDDGYDKGIDTAIRHLKKAPTVENKGQWQMKIQLYSLAPGYKYGPKVFGELPTCSLCGGYTTDRLSYPPFCPNCGARMMNAEVQP